MVVRLISTVHWNTTGGGGITHGQQINATNTGIAGAGLTVGDLTSQAGTTYATNNQTVTGRRFTSPVVISADGVTLSNCLFDFAGGSATRALRVTGNNATLNNLTIATNGASSYYHSILIEGNGCTVYRCDLSQAENVIEDDGDNTLILESFLHNAQAISNPGGHVDVIEVYGGNNHTYRRCRLGDASLDVTATINIAPWFGSSSVAGVLIEDCFIDGGNAHVLVDLQSTGTITNVKVVRNIMGGHTSTGVFGRYTPLQNSDSRAITGSDAAQALNPGSIQWPTTGADLNTWGECSDLSPDRTGQTVSP